MTRRRRPHDPFDVLRYCALAAADGVAAGWTTLLLLIALDVGGLRSLIHGSEDGVVALLILLAGFGSTFSLVGLGLHLMAWLPGGRE